MSGKVSLSTHRAGIATGHLSLEAFELCGLLPTGKSGQALDSKSGPSKSVAKRGLSFWLCRKPPLERKVQEKTSFPS